MRSQFFITIALVVFAACSGRADETLYIKHIRPLLKERCYACHGALKQEAGLRLDTGSFIRTGSDSGSIVDIDAEAKSVLLERLLSEDDDLRMPPIGKPLTLDQVEYVRQWITSGAGSPENETPEPDPSEHWAFRKPVRPDLPAPPYDDWSPNPIDQLLRRRLDSLGLTPAPDADAEQRLRRVTLDLIGIPPTPEQLREFREDPSPEQYLRVVNELLNSLHYGERWGRHWMDVWRYSDWYGRRQQNDVRNSAPQIWRWRDWIVNSLNGDKSYARMIEEMLAADEIAADDDSAWAATGYLIRNYYSLNPNEWMRHNVEFAGKAFLGLTFNCAHCHDHKYDPISHDDYFRMRAFFEPIGIRQDRVAGEPEPPPFEPYKYSGSRKVVRTGMVRIFDEKPEAETWFYTGGDERNRAKERGSIPPGVPTFLNVPFSDVVPIQLPMSGWYPGSRVNIQEHLTEAQDTEIIAAEAGLAEARERDTDTTQQELDLKLAQASFNEAVQAAIASGEQGALAEKQSLLLDGTSGRRIVQRDLPGLTDLADGTTISFKLKILKDSHFNFQLARDTTKSLTASYVGFVDGKIRAYRPGGFSEFVVGDYSADMGVIDMSLCIHPAADVVTLNVDVASGDAKVPVVSNVDIALNAWNPAQNDHQPFTLECRPGTQVLIDDVQVVAGVQNWQWNFEQPDFIDGQDVAGLSGWSVHQLSSGTATSAVSSLAGCESAKSEYDNLRAAEAKLAAATGHVRAAAVRLEAAQQNAASIRATVVADNARRNGADAEVVDDLARQAYAGQLIARETKARWRILDADRELAVKRSLPDADKQKQNLVKELEQQQNAARTELALVEKQSATRPDSADYERLSPVTSRQSTGRRTALAKWVTHPDNPLTPRVAVNHLWLRHFHVPLVDSVDDFGRNGKSPTHPEVLDWLAVELVENDWSMKHIHRLIVTSRAYQMSSSSRGLDSNMAVDVENQNLWRMNAGRMEAEVVRDSVLAIAGTLDEQIGGEVLPNTTAMTTFRRSLYYEVFPESGGNNALAEVFDAPDPGECFRRSRTVVPQQALALSNSELIHAAAKKSAQQIASSTGENNSDFISLAFRRVLSRTANEREHKAAMRFLQHQLQAVSVLAARESLVRVLFNHNDFVTIR